MLLAAVALNADDYDACYMLGDLAQSVGDEMQAIAYYRAALAVNPEFEPCRRSLCLALVRAGQPEQAREVMNERPPVDSASFDYYLFKGNMHLACAEYGDAEAALHTASALDPTNTMVLNNLGAAQLGRRNAVAAVTTYSQSLVIDPSNASTYCNRATAYQLAGEIDSAVHDYRKAVALDPNHFQARQNLLGALSHAHECPPLDYLAEARQLGGILRRQARPFRQWPCQPWSPKSRPLRVGFVSGDFRMHPVGYFLSGVLAHIDREAMQCIAYSNAVCEDAYSQKLKADFVEWHAIDHLTDAELAAHIHANQIDILVDLAGHTAHNRLGVFSWCAAPVQVTWLGYWASTGLSEMDYILVDAVSAPPSDARYFSEKLWYLPHTRLCFTPPSVTADLDEQPLPALRNGFVTLGSFQKLDKLSDATLRAWADILLRLPTARLRLQSRPLEFAESAAHMRLRLERAHIDPGRVDLVAACPWEEYLKSYAEVDIVLDTFPFPGGTTTVEALWMGVPTLTLAGSTLIGRQGESMLRCVGMADWIAHSIPDYVERAVQKSADLHGLDRLRRLLRPMALRSPLFDSVGFANNLTDSMYAMARGRAI